MAIADALLVTQTGVIRRRLTRRTNQVLDGADPSLKHHGLAGQLV
jgi:hypothetical protein